MCDHDAHMVRMRAHTLTNTVYILFIYTIMETAAHRCCSAGATDDPYIYSRSYNLPVFGIVAICPGRDGKGSHKLLTLFRACVYNIMCHLCVCVCMEAPSVVECVQPTGAAAGVCTYATTRGRNETSRFTCPLSINIYFVYI